MDTIYCFNKLLVWKHLGVLVFLFGWALNANANTYILPPQDQYMVGQIKELTIDSNTTLSDEARTYNVGFNEIRLANSGIDPWLPQNNSTIRLPTQHLLPDTERKGIVLNVPEMRLYYFPKSTNNQIPVVITHPISIGRGDWETPLGKARIINKKQNPDWRPPESIRKEHLAEGDFLPEIVPAGPDNPLGDYALRLNIPGYLIHGTNKPYGIGMRVTHGCVRMYPEDIAEIFDSVEINTPVNIVHQPYKFGWYLDTLYLEAHPLVDKDNNFIKDLISLYRAVKKINQQLGGDSEVDWQHALEIASNPTGIPTPVKIKAIEVTETPDYQEKPPVTS